MAAVTLRRRSRLVRLLRAPGHAFYLYRLGFLPAANCLVIAWQVVRF